MFGYKVFCSEYHKKEMNHEKCMMVHAVKKNKLSSCENTSETYTERLGFLLLFCPPPPNIRVYCNAFLHECSNSQLAHKQVLNILYKTFSPFSITENKTAFWSWSYRGHHSTNMQKRNEQIKDIYKHKKTARREEGQK